MRIKGSKLTEEQKEHVRQGVKLAWSDPEKRARRLAKRAETWAKNGYVFRRTKKPQVQEPAP